MAEIEINLRQEIDNLYSKSRGSKNLDKYADIRKPLNKR